MLSLNYQAIYVIWLRQLKRFSRDKGRLISNIVQPFMFLAILGFGLGSATFTDLPAGIGYMEILAPGIIAWSILFPSLFTGLSILWDRQFGFLQEVLVAPVSRTSIVIGTILGGATIAMVQATIVLTISIIMGVSFSISPLLIFALPFMLLTSFVAIGIGLIIASKLQSIEGFQFIMSILIFPLLFLSSPFSPLDPLPSWLKLLAFMDPITYGVDGLRASLVGFSYFPIYVDLLALSVISIVFIMIGSYLFSRSEV
ncbi:MAG: ABC transporter permease [Candidatus Aenigmatarchaeota archaeon]